MNAMDSYWWYVNIGSGLTLVPSGDKPLPEPIFTQFYVAIWRHLATLSKYGYYVYLKYHCRLTSSKPAACDIPAPL